MVVTNDKQVEVLWKTVGKHSSIPFSIPSDGENAHFKLPHL